VKCIFCQQIILLELYLCVLQQLHIFAVQIFIGNSIDIVKGKEAEKESEMNK